MKCVGISDLHGYLPEDVPSCDVVCCCGDIVPLDYQRDTIQSVAWFGLEFVPWVNSLDCKKFIFVAGNHDFFLEDLHIIKGVGWRSPSAVLKRLLPGDNRSRYSKLVYLCDNLIEVEGKVFYGTPWVKDLSNWAFYKPDSELETVYRKVPKKFDVLISHMPSNIGQTGEVLQKGTFNESTDYGSWQLGQCITDRDIKWALCGHVHSGNHNVFETGGCNYVNVSIKDENYRVTYPVFEFEV